MSSPPAPETDANVDPVADSFAPDASAQAVITTTCPRCNHQPNVYQSRCPKCGADLAELFSAVYHPRPAPWARWVAWAILLMFAATLVLALLAIVFGGAPQPGP